MNILVTGGAGFIGLHTAVELSRQGHVPVLVDNFCNSRRPGVAAAAALGGRPIELVELDVRDRAALERVFDQDRPDGVIHFAALKAVGDSWTQALEYHDNNVGGLLSVLACMQSTGVPWLVFSSSATVYGSPDTLPITEDAPLRVTNPYGQTKLMGEEILRELGRCDPSWRFACLRYFNPVGAHPSGLIGEDPQGIPNNLMPYVAQVAVGQRPHLNVFGNDYDTLDGTGVRDYIHVCDLAEGHVAALAYLRQHPGLLTVNLGTGRPVSVLEMVRGLEQASGRAVPYQIAPRRAGDVAACWADPSLAEQLLGWRAQRDVSAMCEDAWRWQSSAARNAA